MLQPTHVTGLIGKWGLGNIGTSGAPNAQGFDEFFGQDTQVGCHNWYPWDGTAAGGRLYRQSTAVEVSANANATIETCGYRIQNCEWANDMYGQEAKKFIAAHADKPFFLCTIAMLSLCPTLLFSLTWNASLSQTSRPPRRTRETWATPTATPSRGTRGWACSSTGIGRSWSETSPRLSGRRT